MTDRIDVLAEIREQAGSMVEWHSEAHGTEQRSWADPWTLASTSIDDGVLTLDFSKGADAVRVRVSEATVEDMGVADLYGSDPTGRRAASHLLTLTREILHLWEEGEPPVVDVPGGQEPARSRAEAQPMEVGSAPPRPRLGLFSTFRRSRAGEFGFEGWFHYDPFSDLGEPIEVPRWSWWAPIGWVVEHRYQNGAVTRRGHCIPWSRSRRAHRAKQRSPDA